MRIRRVIIVGLVLLAIGSMTWFGYKTVFPESPRIFFKTQKPEKRDIHKIVHAEGSLEAQGTLNLGSLINAIVRKIHVKVGQKVTKGTLLADLENDKGGDTDARQAKALLNQAKAMLTYTTGVHEREKALYKSGQLSQENFEKSSQEYESAQADVDRLQASYDKEVFLVEQTRVCAPRDGTIVAINVKEGESVSLSVSPPIVLFEIAENLEVMKATLYIDESKVGDVKVGMLTEISVDTYPYRHPWVGKIESIGMSKAINPSSQAQAGQATPVTYKAEVLIDNQEGLLRPGMSVHAKATIAEATQVLAVPGFVFQLNSKVLEAAAKAMHYRFEPIDPEKKKELLKRKGKTVWIVQNKSFIEKAVEIGITDNAYFQILSGIQETDEIIADDMTASEELKKLAKQIAGS